MKWLTWENVGIDRMGCAWLILRFIDTNAEFQFIPAGQNPQRAGYEPFDIPGVKLTHRRGHSTFHTMLREYQLKDPLLDRIASIIDEADVAQEAGVEPVSAGLDFICQGIRLICPDDQTAFERGRLIYDALYAKLSTEDQTQHQS